MAIKSTTDTVFALSTPVGGAIAVIRATGDRSLAILKEIFTGKIEHRLLSYGKIFNGESIVDEAMGVYFKAPYSYTGEDMFELNVHGSYAVVTAVSRLLIEKGLRYAEAGEFTKRAFLNGKMDLVQAEAVMDLVLSDTERSVNAAIEQLEGGLSRRIAAIEERLIDLMSELSAAMDYPEEMEDEVLSDTPKILQEVIYDLDKLIDNGNSSKIIREGAKVVIIGRPNVGKSSLMNVLTGTHRAIVTNIAGTTRDTIEEHIDLNGVPIRLVDTAGIHETVDEVESIGIERAIAEAKTAEIVLAVFDGANALTDWDFKFAAKNIAENSIFIINKADLNRKQCESVKSELQALHPDTEILLISCETGEGIETLAESICSKFGLSEGERSIVTNERHIECMSRAKNDLTDAVSSVAAMAAGSDIIAVNIGSALMHLGEITGREVTTDVLDRIFSRFCVGK